MTRHRFEGRIAGVGSTSGVRVVIGRWDRSPLGAFADVMLAEPGGCRVLIAPNEAVADFVSSTYTFDRVVLTDVEVRGQWEWSVEAGELSLRLQVGRRLPLGWALRAVPPALATSVGWSRVTDPVSRVLLSGVRTRGTAGQGRREVYGATDLLAITAVDGAWRGRALGPLAPVAPEPNFGFGSTPVQPSVTTLVTTVIETTAAS